MADDVVLGALLPDVLHHRCHIVGHALDHYFNDADVHAVHAGLVEVALLARHFLRPRFARDQL